MKLKYFLFFCLSILLFNSTMVIATVRFVSKTGSSTPPYTSWATASDSIQKCINICNFGDTVYVANGVYKERIVMVPELALIGSGIDSCMIDVRGLITPDFPSSITMANYSTFENFYLLVSDGMYGRGVYNFEVKETKILNNYIYGTTGGVIVDYSTAIVENNIIWGGRGIDMAGRVADTVLVKNNTIYVNENNIGIIIAFGTRPTIVNNVIYTNSKFADGIIPGGSDTTKIFNNFIIAQTPSGYGTFNVSLPTFYCNNFLIGKFQDDGVLVQPEANNICLNNTIINGLKGIRTTVDHSSKIQNNNSWNNSNNYIDFTPDSTNLSIDPMLVDSLDFHLQMYSPLIDAGSPDILDKDGSRSDIGLFGGPYGESYLYKDYAPKPPKGLNVSADTGYVTLIWKNNTESDFSYYKIFRDTVAGFTLDSIKLISIQVDTTLFHTIPSSANNLFYKIIAVDKQGNQSSVSEEVGITLVSVGDTWQITNDFTLYQNYPNPFNPSTVISFRVKERSYVKLAVYDIKGELITYLVNGEKETGYYEVAFSPPGIKALNLASGIYLYKIDIKNDNRIPVFTEVRKMVYIK